MILHAWPRVHPQQVSNPTADMPNVPHMQVGIATWMANAAQDLTGKFVGIWLPISAFAALGFEHCIANQVRMLRRCR